MTKLPVTVKSPLIGNLVPIPSGKYEDRVENPIKTSDTCNLRKSYI